MTFFKPQRGKKKTVARRHTNGIVVKDFTLPTQRALFMSTTNQQLAAIFQQMADVLAIIEGDRFRINSFSKSARILDDLVEDVKAIGPDVKALSKLEGIGKGTAERIVEFLETGKIKDHQQLLDEIPKDLPALLDLPGLGPKTVALLWNEAGIESMDDLKEKLKGDELTKIKGMGAKKVQSLRDNMTFAAAAGQRQRIGEALPLATWFVDQLRKMDGVLEANYAGSLRRGKETIGDLDLLVAAKAKDTQAISDAFTKLEPVDSVIVQGKTKTSIRTKSDAGGTFGGMQVDLRVVEPESFGAALMYFTGSKEHNVRLRERAIKQGYKLNEYALTQDEKGKEKSVASETEEAIYKKLGLSFIAPELREDRGEITLAQNNELPRLIEKKDIVAELHTHTTASDGKWSIREIAQFAIDRGFHTLAITDHSKSQTVANGLSDQRLEAHIVAIREVAAELKGKINLLAGSEVDILADGKLDYPDSLLKQLDLVVASPHHALSQDPDKATKRLLQAIENPYVTIMGHPTGRLVGRRPGLSPDMHALIKAAGERGVALEINANYYRLDLRDTHARAAIEAGVMLAINTDAHGPADFDQLTYGVLTARRAGATAANVINTLSKDDLMKWLAKTRA